MAQLIDVFIFKLRLIVDEIILRLFCAPHDKILHLTLPKLKVTLKNARFFSKFYMY
jgi:hypothetical protein